MEKLFLTEVMCKVSYIHFQYTSCFWRVLTLCISEFKIYIEIVPVQSLILDAWGISFSSVCPNSSPFGS